jgi:Tol biopolymer transport system component
LIAYNGQDGDIWVANADGNDARQVTDSGEGIDYSMTWAPDGSQLAFRTTRGRSAPGVDPSNIFIIDLKTGEERQLTPPSGGIFPAWSPDGTWIAFSDRHGINLIRPDGSDVRRLGTDGECSVWSPDGSRIMYCSNAVNRGGSGDNWDIFVINRDGTGRARLTHGPYSEHNGVWSPDGSRIIFSSDRDGSVDLYRMNADGTQVVQLTDTEGIEAGPAAWLSDGRLILAHYEPEAPLGHWYLTDESGRPVASLPWLYGALDPIAYLPAAESSR